MAAKKLSFSDAVKKLAKEGDPSLFGGGGAGASGGAEGGGRREEPAESVTHLAARIKAALEGLGTTVRVRGEISNLSARNHWYFSLKDEGAVIGCAMWQSDVARLGAGGAGTWTPKEGDEVIATGSVSYWAPQGRTQLYVRKLERVGLGSLQERFEALCVELRGLGYFDDQRKRALPTFPRRIAIVTSGSGAAIHDCLRTAHERMPAVGIVVVDVRVQGEGAAEEVARAIQALDRSASRLGIDAVVVTRGGGSIEDLWAFNERSVADAIFARRNVPIVAAIGHESDTTIAELVADRRASTPTQAIMQLLPDRAELTEQVAQLADRLAVALRRSVRTRRDLLAALARRPSIRSPMAPVDAARSALGERSAALGRAVRRACEREEDRLAHLASRLGAIQSDGRVRQGRDALRQRGARLVFALDRRVRVAADRLAARRRQLDALDPTSVLSRGFSYTMRGDGRLLRSVADATPGMWLATVLVDGTVHSVVEDPGDASRSPRQSPRRSVGPATDGGGLFAAPPDDVR